jgi:hypothetical protein
MPQEITEITENHIIEYLQKQENSHIPDLRNVPRDFIFEAFCEMIVKKNNPSYKITSLANEYKTRTGDKNLENEDELDSFLRDKLDRVISDSTKEIISISQYEEWVSSATQGVYELSK